jgi:hypothetical protein
MISKEEEHDESFWTKLGQGKKQQELEKLTP